MIKRTVFQLILSFSYFNSSSNSYLQLQSSLGKILTNLSDESLEEEDDVISSPFPTSDVSMTEEILSRNPNNKSASSIIDAPSNNSTKKASTGKGLSQTISFDDEDETSSTVSFDSDGLPVRRSKSTKQGEGTYHLFKYSVYNIDLHT